MCDYDEVKMCECCGERLGCTNSRHSFSHPLSQEYEVGDWVCEVCEEEMEEEAASGDYADAGEDFFYNYYNQTPIKKEETP